MQFLLALSSSPLPMVEFLALLVIWHIQKVRFKPFTQNLIITLSLLISSAASISRILFIYGFIVLSGLSTSTSSESSKVIDEFVYLSLIYSVSEIILGVILIYLAGRHTEVDILARKKFFAGVFLIWFGVLPLLFHFGVHFYIGFQLHT